MNVARKMAVVDAVNHALSQRIDAAVWTLDGLTESRNTASKSTAGDKHETGRARSLVYFNPDIYRYDVNPRSGFSVRCLRDAD
jgi:hypothetical protein